MMIEITNTLDIVRKSVNGSSCRLERSKIGQFLTPAKIARFMASLFERQREHVRILDAGAGMGALFAACVETNCFWEASPPFNSCGRIRKRSEDIAILERNNGLVRIDLPEGRYFL